MKWEKDVTQQVAEQKVALNGTWRSLGIRNERIWKDMKGYEKIGNRGTEKQQELEQSKLQHKCADTRMAPKQLLKLWPIQVHMGDWTKLNKTMHPVDELSKRVHKESFDTLQMLCNPPVLVDTQMP